MHLVGFVIRIYHDALSPERQWTHKPQYSSLINTCINLYSVLKEVADVIEVLVTNLFVIINIIVYST